MSQAIFELPFWRAFLADPLKIASPLPSGPALGRAIAAQIDPRKPGAVLELGPGSGAVTAALLARGVPPADLIAIEWEPGFCSHLRRRFPGATIIQGDAFAFSGQVVDRPLKAIVSGLPVLGLSRARRRHFLGQALDTLGEDGVFVQFSYSPLPPLPGGHGIKVAHRTVWANLPPMQVWRYSRG
jgi:phosphatidylethanolamine/phosphatidyl-N-methylethanolamine N-methyltransferase